MIALVKERPNPDVGLLPAAAAGDHKAFMELIRPHDLPLRRLVGGMVRDQGRMDDILQDAYLKAYRGLATFDQRSSFGTWLYRIAHNCAVDNIRRTAKVIPIAQDQFVDDLTEDHSSMIRLDVGRAMAALSPDERAVIILVDVQGMDYLTAAGILGVARGTVASRLSHARQHIQKALSNYREEER